MFKNNIHIYMSRVGRFLPICQVDVYFLRLPPGFPAVPQYFNHVSVGPGSHMRAVYIIIAEEITPT